MAKLRKFVAYRSHNRPYTRKSKYRSKSYVRASPHSKISRYRMGNLKDAFAHTIELIADEPIQIRDNALESARLTTFRKLETHVGKNSFFFHLKAYPHHILRENPLASGAGADRMSTGMKKSFGKAIGVAAQLHKGQAIFTLGCNETHLEFCKKALKAAGTKLPCHCRVVIK